MKLPTVVKMEAVVLVAVVGIVMGQAMKSTLAMRASQLGVLEVRCSQKTLQILKPLKKKMKMMIVVIILPKAVVVQIFEIES
jgi:hypothetical protein